MTYDQKTRVMDILVAVALIIIFSPLFIIVPILIFIDSGWPVIFTHKRVGKGGEDFELFKFRSMVLNADEILHHKNHKLLQQFKQGDWKIAAKDDPRITPLGRFLRSFTIDEFPQLFNVLKGQMSMVGPRAYVRKELEEQSKKYPETKKYIPYILSVKPGITGPWQTSGRNEIPFYKRAEMDSEYAAKKNIKNDILILLRTPKAMFSKW